ncbi:transcriptional regulator PecS [Roseobacter sp. SK209-2-6]|uniref:MarR family winged helix-turn-helix transcriptional regulator n=1 Tax=Roseobacter sp. SK209-2-6 TaxID=388739 RepID=UPI0000F3C7FB|nr:MarR family transcriptional regulator [Roseobacter sp. SK209-2-6]EBA18103.1 transcriptional regulator PecS [Roseobacter sp. SK209-2-6]
MDHVDFVTQQWAKERPDLDVSSMGVIGRVARLYLAYGEGMQKNFACFGLNAAKFDVLATLRRAGAPYRLSPGDLLKATMVTSGTMTNRIARLEADGMVQRFINPDDSRSFLIELTEEGLLLIDRVLEAHVTRQSEMLAGLSQEERAGFEVLLKRALSVVESSG